jgi:RNA polymerase sigma factor (sigma-70 family)
MSAIPVGTLHTWYTHFVRELDRFAQRRLNHEDADDAVHDAYVRVMQYTAAAVPENPRAYLYRVVGNVATDRALALKAQSERHDPDCDLEDLLATAPAPDAVIEARERLRHCLQALDELPPAYRHAFVLHRVDGLTQAEVAAALRIPRRSVERYIAKALEHCLMRMRALDP